MATDMLPPKTTRKTQPAPEAAAAPEATEPQGFVPPAVQIGDIVQWMPPGKDAAWMPAVVQRVNGDGSIFPSVFCGKPMIDASRVAVCHKDDPRLHGDGRQRYGMWDVTEQWKDIQTLKADVEALKVIVAELQKK